MANEITVNLSVGVVNGNLSETFSAGALQFTQDAIGGPTPGYLTIGTSEESEAFSELTTEGWLYMRNLDASNYVRWGFATTVYGGRMEAGEPAAFRLNPAATLFLIADTAACKVVVYAFED